MIKPIQIALAPTRNRPMNVFFGVVLGLSSLLLLLSLATYRATDPSLNTSTDPGMPVAIGNWIGPIGAYVGDLILQTLGFTAFFLPHLDGSCGLGMDALAVGRFGLASRRGRGAVAGVSPALCLGFFPGICNGCTWSQLKA